MRGKAVGEAVEGYFRHLEGLCVRGKTKKLLIDQGKVEMWF